MSAVEYIRLSESFCLPELIAMLMIPTLNGMQTEIFLELHQSFTVYVLLNFNVKLEKTVQISCLELSLQTFMPIILGNEEVLYSQSFTTKRKFSDFAGQGKYTYVACANSSINSYCSILLYANF